MKAPVVYTVYYGSKPRAFFRYGSYLTLEQARALIAERKRPKPQLEELIGRGPDTKWSIYRETREFVEEC